MDKPMSRFHFWCMSVVFKVRDLLVSPMRKLEEAAVGPGAQVLDFGCGPGSFSIAAAQRVGSTGRVYALDIHPDAVKAVEKKAARKGLANVETIRAASPSQRHRRFPFEWAGGLETESIDVVLLYDTFHMISDQEGLLRGLHRVLKADGRISLSDHHMKHSDILEAVTQGGWFELSKQGKLTYTFTKPTKARSQPGEGAPT